MVDFGELVSAVRDGEATFEIVPVGGGRNNRVCRVRVDGSVYCCKIYKLDEHRRQKREWAALTFLADAGVAFAPLPLHQESDAVVMSWLDGSSLGGRMVTDRELDALGEVLESLYGLKPPSAMPAVVGSPDVTVDRMRSMTIVSASPASVEAQRWLATSEPESLRGLPLNIVGRGDPNLLNCIGVGDTVRLIDWEYSGTSNKAFELADLVEHIESRATPDTAWNSFVHQMQLSDAELAAYKTARRLLSIFWLCLLQPGQRGAMFNPPDALARQEQRVLEALT